MTLRTRVIASGVLAMLTFGGCAPSAPTLPPAPSPVLATPTPTELPTPPPTPTPTPTVASPEEAPPGTVMVDIPAAGIRIPVPEGWDLVDSEALDDPARRDEIVDRYPGAGLLLAAAAEMGGRAVPAFAAFDPAPGSPAALTPNIAVLVSQPSVGGPLLDLVAGFVGTGFEDAFGAEEVARERVATPLGEAVRLEYVLSSGGETAMTAVEYLVGAPAGTLLVSVMGPADVVAAVDPDALVAALAPLPSPQP